MRALFTPFLSAILPLDLSALLNEDSVGAKSVENLAVLRSEVISVLEDDYGFWSYRPGK